MRCLKKQSGFTLVEIMVVVGLIGLLASIALPNFIKARDTAKMHVCIENLTQIESAKQILGVEKGLKSNDQIAEADLIGPNLYIKKMPQCPGAGNYDIHPLNAFAECTLGPTLNHTLTP